MPIIPSYRNIAAAVSGIEYIYDTELMTYDYYVNGTAILSSDFTIDFSGTPIEGMTLVIHYNANITVSTGKDVVIFGIDMPQQLTTKECEIYIRRSSTAWEVKFVSDAEEAGSISENDLATDSVTTDKIAIGTVTLAKLATQSNNTILANVSGGAASPAALSLAQNTFLANASGTLAAITADDESLIGRTTAGNLGNIAVAASRIVGRTAAGNLAALTGIQALGILPLADANLYIGSGTAVPVANPVTGVVAMTNAGVFSFTAGAIINADVGAAAAIVESKLSLNYSTSSLNTRIVTLEASIATDTVTITTANVQNLDTVSQIVIAQPGSGYFTLVEYVHMGIGGVAYGNVDAGDDLQIEYSDGTDIVSFETTGFLNSPSEQRFAKCNYFDIAATGLSSINPKLYDNLAVIITNLGNAVTAGSDLTIVIKYQTIALM